MAKKKTRLRRHQADAVRLDLACGETPLKGFQSVDLFAKKPNHRVDLLAFPWPWKNGSVDEINCSHFIEHIPMVYVTLTGEYNLMPGVGRVDLLLAFFNECGRILRKGGVMKCTWPALQSARAFWDPTHRRFIPPQTMQYLGKGWREASKLDHYLGVTCDLLAEVCPTVDGQELLRAPEVSQSRVTHMWNVAQDWVATLRKVK